MDWKKLGQEISAHIGTAFEIEQKSSVGGGCINEAWHIYGKGRDFFLKLNRASELAMFEAEHRGLADMFATDTIRVPEPLLTGVAGSQAYILMEYIPLGGRSDAQAMGEQLAAMHGHTAERFGWHVDNTIGSTPQPNDWMDDWVIFWREQRLGYQIDLAARKGIGSKAVTLCEQLMDCLEVFFEQHVPAPSLLHGDLWGGNAAYDEQGRPVIFDPACYYGDREADLAMTELFGGFGPEFSAAYQYAWPLDDGYQIRKILYNQYHIINHFNLFGGGYGMQAERMAAQLLAECR